VQVVEFALVQSQAAEARHQRLLLVREQCELALQVSLESFVRIDDPYGKSVFMFGHTFDPLAAPGQQRDGSVAAFDRVTRLTNGTNQCLPGTAECDARQVGAKSAALAFDRMAVHAFVTKDVAAGSRVAARDFERRHRADASQVSEDGPDFRVRGLARRHDRAFDAVADRRKHALVRAAGSPKLGQIRPAHTSRVGAVAVGAACLVERAPGSDRIRVSFQRISALRHRRVGQTTGAEKQGSNRPGS